MKKIAILSLVLFATGCSYQKFQLDDKAALTPAKEGTSHFFVAGIGQTHTIDAKAVCGDRGVRATETSYSFLNGLLTGITYGLYAPRSYAVYCN